MTGKPWADAVLAAAALLAALGVIGRAFHLPELLKGIRLFLLDWLGEPERNGVTGRPSFPARMGAVEDRTERTEQRVAQLNHDLRGDVTSRLQLLAHGQDALHATAGHNAEALARLDERVTDHRRRNEEQVRLLSDAIARQEAALDEVRRRGQLRRQQDPPDPAQPPEEP